MKVKTNFKQMYLVDNVLYNKLNQHSLKPYSNLSHPPSTITFQPPPTFHLPTTTKDNVLQDDPQSFETKSVPPKQDNPSVKTEPPLPNNKEPENLSNAKPFEIEAHRYLDNIGMEYKPYIDEALVKQPDQQQKTKALDFNEPKQLPVSKHESPKQLLSKNTPVIQDVSPLALAQPMDYQPALKQTEVMQVDDECKECAPEHTPSSTYLALPPPQPTLPLAYTAPPSTYPPSTLPALPPPPTFAALTSTYPVLQSSFTYPAQSSLNPSLPLPQPVHPPTNPALPAPPSNPALPAPPTNPALPAPPINLALPAPPTNPALLAPPSFPALLPPPTNPTPPLPALLPPQPALPSTVANPTSIPSPAKYEAYTKSKQIPTMMSYICTRCNTSFKKESSLINHNKRFHQAFDQSVKGVKRLSKDEITHGEKKIPKIVIANRKQNLNKRMLTYEPYPQST